MNVDINNLGKGIFIWKVSKAEGGDIQEIIGKSKVANFNHVLIKIANGIYGYNYSEDLSRDLAKELSEGLYAEGIQPWGWHYLFSDNPVKEAETALRRIKETGVVGYVINAEGHSKEKYTNAQSFVDTLESLLIQEGIDIPIGLSSYRYPSYHSDLPWRELMSICDFMMPQVYWMEAHNPAEQVNKTLGEYRTFLNWEGPMVLTGSAFDEWGWKPTVEEINEFINEVKTNNIKSINFWEWKETKELRDFGSNYWKAVIKDFDWSWTDNDSDNDTGSGGSDTIPEHDHPHTHSEFSELRDKLSKLSSNLGLTKVELSQIIEENKTNIKENKFSIKQKPSYDELIYQDEIEKIVRDIFSEKILEHKQEYHPVEQEKTKLEKFFERFIPWK